MITITIQGKIHRYNLIIGHQIATTNHETFAYSSGCTRWDCIYRQVSNIRRTEFQNLNVSRLGLQLSLPNSLKPGVKVDNEDVVGAAPRGNYISLPTKVRLILETWRYLEFNLIYIRLILRPVHGSSVFRQFHLTQPLLNLMLIYYE